MALSVAGRQEAKNQKVTSCEPASVYGGLSHRSQELGLAGCDDGECYEETK